MSDALWERFRDEYRRVRLDFDQYLDAMCTAAIEDTNGVLLNRLGRRQGIDARSLFYGPFSRVEKYASEELYAWFEQDEKRRMTWEQYVTMVVETPRIVMAPAGMTPGEAFESMTRIMVLPQDEAPTTVTPREALESVARIVGLSPDSPEMDEVVWTNREGWHR